MWRLWIFAVLFRYVFVALVRRVTACTLRALFLTVNTVHSEINLPGTKPVFRQLSKWLYGISHSYTGIQFTVM